MLTPQEISAKLKDRIVKTVADATGLHRNTIQKVRDATEMELHAVNYLTIVKLSDYFEAQDEV